MSPLHGLLLIKVHHLFGVLLAEVLGRIDHVGQSSLGLGPLTGLETAVRVDPELFRTEVLEHLLDAVLDLLLAGDTRRVDVVDTGSNVTGVGLVNEDLEQLGIGLAVLNAQNIGIQSGNSVEEVLELRVAEVRVNLSAIGNTGGGQAEGADSPLEVVLTLLAGTERETLTEGRLIDLDDLDTSSLKVDDFVTEGKSQLLSLDGLVDIVTRERPPETGDGTSEHTLHGLLGDGDSVLGLLDGHGGRTRDVTDNDGRTHATGSVTLDPGVGSENVTGETLTEVLDHVVTLRLTVDEDIQVELFLDLDNILDLLLDELLVLLRGDFTLGELVTLDTDLLGLRERSDGGGGEERKVDRLALLGKTDGECRLAVVHLLGDGSLALLDLGVVGAAGRGTALNRLGVGLELLTDGSGALSDGLGDHNDFGSLLDSEAKPVTHLGVEVLLACKGVGDVEEGAGSGDDHTVLAKLLNSQLNLLNSSLEVGLPDVTAVDNTSRKDLVGAKSANDGVKLLRVTDKVNVDTVEVVKSRKDINVVNDVTEVGGENDARSLVTESAELLVGRLEGILGLGGKVKDEDRLINLNVLSTSLLQLLEELDVDREEVIDLGDGVNGLTTVSLGKSQERDRSQDDGTSDDASLLGLKELNNRLGLLGELESLVVLKSGLDVVVVGVKPLNHFLYTSIRTIDQDKADQ